MIRERYRPFYGKGDDYYVIHRNDRSRAKRLDKIKVRRNANLVGWYFRFDQKLSFEHLDTLDRYLLAYESNKRLENVITKLKGEEED